MQLQMQQKYHVQISDTDDMSLFEFQTLYKIFVDFIKAEEEEMKKAESKMNQSNKLTLTNPLSSNIFGNRFGM